MPLESLLEAISRHHFPNPPAPLQELEAFERRVGWRLDPDLRAFYLHCNGAELFRKPDSPYRLLSLSQVIRARVAIFGPRGDDDAHGPAAWYALCALHDGNFALVDVATSREGRYPILDGYAEAFPDPAYCKPIAGSFSEFLEGALRSDGRWFWL